MKINMVERTWELPPRPCPCPLFSPQGQARSQFLLITCQQDESQHLQCTVVCRAKRPCWRPCCRATLHTLEVIYPQTWPHLQTLPSIETDVPQGFAYGASEASLVSLLKCIFSLLSFSIFFNIGHPVPDVWVKSIAFHCSGINFLISDYIYSYGDEPLQACLRCRGLNKDDSQNSLLPYLFMNQ